MKTPPMTFSFEFERELVRASSKQLSRQPTKKMEELSINTVPVGRARPSFAHGGKKTSVGDYHDQFVSMILKAQAATQVPPPPKTTGSLSTKKRETSIDTSTFTFIERYSSRREIEVPVVTVSDKPLDHGTLTQMVIELV